MGPTAAAAIAITATTNKAVAAPRRDLMAAKKIRARINRSFRLFVTLSESYLRGDIFRDFDLNSKVVAIVWCCRRILNDELPLQLRNIERRDGGRHSHGLVDLCLYCFRIFATNDPFVERGVLHDNSQATRGGAMDRGKYSFPVRMNGAHFNDSGDPRPRLQAVIGGVVRVIKNLHREHV
jgi:hypothetical protein